MATSVEIPSPASVTKGSSGSLMGASPVFCPSSDKRFWSTLRNRVDLLLENQKPIIDSDQFPSEQNNAGAADRAKRLKEDRMLLLRGFDSVAYSLSQLSNNLENALQGARDLAGPPTLTELVQCTLEKAKSEEGESRKEDSEETKKESEGQRGSKRKLESQESSDDNDDSSKEENEHKSLKELGKFKRAKNLAMSMATKAAALARELKSMKSDLCFMQERCTLLEEENRRLRDGFTKGIRPEEDDLVRLQLEALLAEKSRLANENANLTRENQCLHQLVEYHQLTSQDLSASYENLVRGMCLDFSSPATIPEEDRDDEGVDRVPYVPHRTDISGCSKTLDGLYDEEEQAPSPL